MEFLKARDGKLHAGDAPILLRGMGLGGWLLPEGYMWKFYTKCDRPRRMEKLLRELCGAEYAQSFWESYYQSYITEQDIAWIAAQGLNSVRLPMNARHLFQVSETGVEFNSAIVQYVDACLDWCKKHGLYLILDMHAAPGGQTGQNIDDSEADIPELFTHPENQDLLVRMWELLAYRYAGEPAIGGYDLINEPICKWNSELYPQLLPLYRRLLTAIRRIDPDHLVILEGAHWATDFSIFDPLTPEEAGDNIALEFHKYWNDPDVESLAPYLAVAERLRVPLWMGEGGENNCQWYTAAFPMYERLGIGWCFWSYKKMEMDNSPVTFAKPERWDALVSYLDGGEKPEDARTIFEAFLDSIRKPQYRVQVVDALLRRPEIEIPAAAFDAEQIESSRIPGAAFRTTSHASLLFADGHTGAVDWQRYGGEPQPENQKILLHLFRGDRVAYRVNSDATLSVVFCGEGSGELNVCGIPAKVGERCTVQPLHGALLWIECASAEAILEKIIIRDCIVG